MAEIKDTYKTILDDEDYAEIEKSAAEIPVSEKTAATHKSEDYVRGEMHVKTAAFAMNFIFAADLVFSVLRGSVPFSVCTGLCLIAAAVSTVHMLRGKVFARYIAVGINGAGIIICTAKMIGVAGGGSGTAFILVIWLIEGAAEIALMLIFISGKSVNAFFTYNGRLDRLRDAGRKRNYLNSIGKRFK